MTLLSPTQRRRLNEVAGFLLLSLGLTLLLSFVSYHAQDPSWSTATVARPLNLIGYPGSYLSDLLLQGFGAAAFLFPFLIFLLAWKWIRSEPVEARRIGGREDDVRTSVAIHVDGVARLPTHKVIEFN